MARISATIAALGGSGIIACLNPADYLSMSIVKASGSCEYLGLPANLADRVVSVAAITQGNILAFAQGSGASWAERQATTVVAGLTGTQFTRNALTLLCECRVATLVRDPAHVQYGDLVGA